MEVTALLVIWKRATVVRAVYRPWFEKHCINYALFPILQLRIASSELWHETSKKKKKIPMNKLWFQQGELHIFGRACGWEEKVSCAAASASAADTGLPLCWCPAVPHRGCAGWAYSWWIWAPRKGSCSPPVPPRSPGHPRASPRVSPAPQEELSERLSCGSYQLLPRQQDGDGDLAPSSAVVQLPKGSSSL